MTGDNAGQNKCLLFFFAVSRVRGWVEAKITEIVYSPDPHATQLIYHLKALVAGSLSL